MPESPARAAIEALYREVVLDHYRRPRNRSPLERADASATVANPLCGDQVKVEVRLENGRIEEVSARARGCSIAVAAGSVMTELCRGLEPEAARSLGGTLARVVTGELAAGADLDPRLAAFARVAELPSRQRCATLAWEALARALDLGTG